MADQATRTRRGKPSAAELLERIATDPDTTDADRARAITDLAKLRHWLPPDLVKARRAAVARLHAGGIRPVDINRLLGFALYAGRAHQILRAHREATDGAA